MKVYQALQKQRRKEQNLEEEARRRREKEKALLPPEEEDEPDPDEEEEADIHTREIEEEEEAEEDQDPRRHKWLLYPGMSKTDMKSAEFPKLPTRQRHYHQPPAPINLDLSRPTEQPILLATGGLGGLGNPHFTSRAHPRPIFATRGAE